MTDEEIRSFLAGKNGGEVGIRKVQFPSLTPLMEMEGLKTGMFHLEDVHIEISVELGRAELKVGEVLGLAEGSIIKLDKAVGEAVEVNINQQGFAKGEVVIINDIFGIRVSAINHKQNLKLTEELI
ncbi:MAG: Flagellar motor switch protein FliN [Pelotomaculum sp. PtaU1.Bin035]|nr:MAG: Flagellar motor switch protein FliN [Pelotomaculum sp. PtaU1.Bin035]